MINFLLGSFVILFSIFFNAEKTFEGSIKLVQETLYDTCYYTYQVKGNNVRIDEFDVKKELKQSFIVDIENAELFILSHPKKLYKKEDLILKDDSLKENYIIQKTQNSKEIQNYTCYQWRVKSIESNTEVAYWVWEDNFYFFEKVLPFLNNTQKTYEFFKKIPDTNGFFPILTVERTLLRREKSRTYVTEINKKPMDDSLFSVPKDYQLLKH